MLISTATTADLLTIVPPTSSLNSKSVSSRQKQPKLQHVETSSTVVSGNFPGDSKLHFETLFIM